MSRYLRRRRAEQRSPIQGKNKAACLPVPGGGPKTGPQNHQACKLTESRLEISGLRETTCFVSASCPYKKAAWLSESVFRQLQPHFWKEYPETGTR